MKKIIIGAAIIFGLIGCAEEPYNPQPIPLDPFPSYCHGSFRIEPGFSDQQRAHIGASIARFNSFLGMVYFRIEPDGKCPIFPERIDAKPFAECACYTNGFGLRVDVDDVVSYHWNTSRNFQAIIIHELGHSINMQHLVDDKKTLNYAVMAPTTDTISFDFTARDRAECQRIGFCKKD